LSHRGYKLLFPWISSSLPIRRNELAIEA
jgi:hypothetical protein